MKYITALETMSFFTTNIPPLLEVVTEDSGHDYTTPGIMFLNEHQHISDTVHVGIHDHFKKL